MELTGCWHGVGLVLVQCSRVVSISQQRDILFTCMSHEDIETHSLATLLLGSFHFTNRSIAKNPFNGELLKVSVNFNKSSCKSWTASSCKMSFDCILLCLFK